MSRPTAAKLVAQHAETSRLLGVDFVPVYRASGAEAVVQAPVAAEPVRDEGPILEARPAPVVRAAGGGDKRARLEELRERYEREAPHRHFKTAHTKIVFGEGDPDARLMFVGEAPGAEEDRLGRPFVGRSGQLLDKMIAAMGLRREQVYIANVLKTRPPDNATPTSDEIELCAPYLFEQIAIIAPEAVVSLGLPAARALLSTMDSMTRLRGHWTNFRPGTLPGVSIPVMPTYHPAFVLRQYTAEVRGKVWSDLKQVMDRLGLKSSAASPA